MQWTTKIRDELQINVSENRIPTMSKDKWRKMRNESLTKHKNICRYCGGKYYSYLHCIKTNIGIDIACSMCYMVTHINYFPHDLVVVYSSKKQIDIVKDTVNYVKTYHKMPKIENIDKNAKEVPLSILEFASFFFEYKEWTTKMPYLKNYKVFFSEMFDTTVLGENNYGSMFLEDAFSDSTCEESVKIDESVDDININKRINMVNMYQFTDKELKFITDHFNNDNKLKIKHNIENVIKTYWHQKNDWNKILLEYQMLKCKKNVKM